MRFVRARTDSGVRVGVIDPDGMVSLSTDVTSIEPHLSGGGDSLDALAAHIRATATRADVADLDLTRPVDPTSMRDFMVFEQHAVPSWRARGMPSGPDVWFEQPIGYFSNAASLLGPADDVETPGGSQQLDFELEVGAVIGREARSITPEQAAAHIAGYVIVCDWSARDLQFREMEGQLGPFKGKDFASSLGSVFVTPDELADRRSGTGFDLTMTASVNGRVYGTDRWASAYWSLEELLSYASWNSTVEAGALIATGTCQGGCILELSLRHGAAEYPYLVAGDRVDLVVEELGSIRAGVRPASRGEWPARRARGPVRRIGTPEQ